MQLTCDVKILTQWLSHDILALAGPGRASELFDFIVKELSLGKPLSSSAASSADSSASTDALLGFAAVKNQS